MKHKTKKQKNIKRITQSIPFYTISIFFAHFIHMHLMQNPNIFHAIFALLVSFSISFCFIYCLEYSIDWIHNFQDKLLEESKAAKNTIEDQQKIIEDQRKRLKDIEILIEEKLDERLIIPAYKPETRISRYTVGDDQKLNIELQDNTKNRLPIL